MKKLYLDDLRIPKDSIGFVPDIMNQFYWANDWVIVRNFWEFCNYINKFGLPDFISFDHDLSDEHYVGDVNYQDYKEKTGYEAAKWLVDWCVDNNKSLPDFVVHSANPVGKLNIESYLNNAKKHLL
jgi:hypothetical protein